MTNPTIIPGYKNTKGYFCPATSSCCRARLVFYDPMACLWTVWYAVPAQPGELRCEQCNRVVEAADAAGGAK